MHANVNWKLVASVISHLPLLGLQGWPQRHGLSKHHSMLLSMRPGVPFGSGWRGPSTWARMMNSVHVCRCVSFSLFVVTFM